MVAAKGGLDPRSWKRTADYILDVAGETSLFEKVASYRVTNCDTDDPGLATELIEWTQDANTRSKADKTYHLVFSFPPGEEPPIEVLHAIEDELCAAIGFTDHQRISAVHQDTDHLHVHVAINKVHPTGFQNIEPFYDKQRLMETCERLEIKYGLTRTNHGLTEGKAYDRRERIRLERSNEHDTRFREYLRKSYNLEIAERPEAKTYNDLRDLSGGGVAHGPKGYSELLPGNARHRVDESGAEPADGVRRSRNGTGTVGGRIKLDGIAADIEAHAGIETLIGYVAREVAPAMRAASSWGELHAALGDHGLVIKQRAAGFVIGDEGLGLWCKASQPGRDLSAKALTDRLGSFEPPIEPGNPDGVLPADGAASAENSRPVGHQQTARETRSSGHERTTQREHARASEQGKAPGGGSDKTTSGGTRSAGGQGPRRYSARPRQQHPSSSRLFAEYQKERQQALGARRQRMAALRAETADRRAALRKWAATQRMIAKAATRGADRKLAYSAVRAQLTASRAAIMRDVGAARAKSRSDARLPTWNDWLADRAGRGDVEALSVLRARADREEKMRGDLLTAERADKARTVILDTVKALARKDGAVSYRTADGGLVLDRATHVQAQKATAGAALVALTLAADRFQGQALDVRGSDQFRRDVARLAGLHGVRASFSDPALEALRKAAEADRAGRNAKAGPKRPESAKTASGAKIRKLAPPVQRSWNGSRHAIRFARKYLL